MLLCGCQSNPFRQYLTVRFSASQRQSAIALSYMIPSHPHVTAGAQSTRQFYRSCYQIRYKEVALWTLANESRGFSQQTPFLIDSKTIHNVSCIDISVTHVSQRPSCIVPKDTSKESVKYTVPLRL